MAHPVLEFLDQAKPADGRMLILTHNHPDPDAIASAWALAHLAECRNGVRCRIAYGGIIGRMENQMMVKILRVPIHPFRAQMLDRFRDVALVDTQPPFQNNPFPAGRRAALVVDHHPRNARTKAECSVIDQSAGATATILAEACLEAGIEIPARLATALVYGITSETQNLGRETGPRDVSAYRALFGKASIQSLSRIQNPPRPSSFFYTLGKAIKHAFTISRVIGVHLGPVPSQDIVAHMADFLMTHEKMRWSLVTGRFDGKLFVSLRTRQTAARAGRLLWRLLGAGTSAGGHRMIAGGSVVVGNDASEEQWRAEEERITMDFLKSQGLKDASSLQYPYQTLQDN
jgi:nanoRNase/pAp phosphatase (c-di-AMP/oligoRNAs hydrolase)